ncbi:hypothetical protein BC832DRAFT_323957 [Gaertneriomyces semiglobifer]|nr:hypothetical protein BC832DRAFT_323957 [Gaertneriomyces semiglobifer]
MPTWMAVDVANTALHPRLVVVQGIPEDADENIAKQYFTLCGDPDAIEFSTPDKGHTREALILFREETSAVTALSLSGLLIEGKPVSVYLYADAPPENACETSGHHPKLAQMLAKGMVTAEQLDERFGIVDRTAGVLTRLQNVADYLKEKQTVQRATGVASTIGTKALGTGLGKKIQSTFEAVKVGVVEIAEDARIIVEREKALNEVEKAGTGQSDVEEELQMEAFPDPDLD